MKRRILVATFDVSGLSEDEVDGLTLEVVVQGEASERHPDVVANAEVIDLPVEEVRGPNPNIDT